jgi:hypothetical protein
MKMTYAIYSNEGTLVGGNIRPRKIVGHKIFGESTFPTVKAARDFWYDADMGNGNHMLVLPASTPEDSYYPPIEVRA